MAGVRKLATNFLVHEKIWLDKFKYDDAERRFYEQMNGPVAGASSQENCASVILRDTARARENIPKSLAGNSGPEASGGPSADHSELVVRIASESEEPEPARRGTGAAADHLQAGGAAERAGEELAWPPGHGPTDPAHVFHAPGGAAGQEASHTSRG